MDDHRLVRRRIFCLTLLVGLVAVPDALAAFPGANGRIVVQTTDGLDTINADGGGRLDLVSEPGVFATPTWSADGRRVAFASNRGGDTDFEVYSIGAGGGAITPLTSNTVEDGDPSWSPDGSRIAFVRDTELEPSQIYAMNANGTGQVPLLSGILEDTAPAWSPDGTRLAFARGPGDSSDIWIMTASGFATRLTTDPADETNPDWSPDGSRIVFQRGGALVVLAMNGTPQPPLLVPDGAQRPAWAPDGSRILFDVSGAVWSVNPDGTGATPLTTAGTAALLAQAPSWQPLPRGDTGAPGPGGGQGGSGPGGGPGPRTSLLRRSIKALLRTNRAGRYTVFVKLSVSPVRRGDTLRLTCSGRGCPLKRVRVQATKSRGSLSLLRHLRGANLRKGAVVRLLVSRKGAIGRATTWKIRAPKSPRIARECLPAGKRKLTRCPS
jgi:Tol biopolymer transport system component